MADWYDCIEPEVRDLVRLLRNEGFNTICSGVGHDLHIEMQYIMDSRIMDLHNLLFNAGYRNYEINVLCTVDQGHQYNVMSVVIKDKGVLANGG